MWQELRGQDFGRKEGQTDRRTDGQMHTQADEGHVYSPPPPISGDKMLKLIWRDSNISLRSKVKQKHSLVIAIKSICL